MRFALPAALIASLAFAAPAFGQVQVTVGQPNVITDPAQVGAPAAPAPAPVPQPQTPQAPGGGNQSGDLAPGDTTPPPLHVDQHLIGRRPALSTATQVSSPPPAQPVAAVTATRDPQPAASDAPAATSGRQLPFTGIDTWQIALLGFMMLGSGAALWRLGESRS